MPGNYPPPLPRLHFSGKFFSDPSTINNDVRHFDTANFRPSYQRRGADPYLSGYWNPEGSGAFALVGCKINAVKTDAGGLQYAKDLHSSRDSLLGGMVGGNKESVQAKMVDLDPQMQTVSQIWGLHINIGNESEGFSSLMQTISFRDMWGSLEGAEGSGAYSAVYQGVLGLSHFNAASSIFLQECALFVEDSKTFVDYQGNTPFPNGALSIRMWMNKFEADHTSENFRYGEVRGIIQPWLKGQPYTFDAFRSMKPMPRLYRDPAVKSMTAYCRIQESRNVHTLYVDLINSLYLKPEGTPEDIGTLYICSLPDGISNPDNHVIIGKVDYLAPGWIEDEGGIVELPLTSAQFAEAIGKPLALIAFTAATADGAAQVILAESDDGVFLRPDQYVFRINTNDQVSTEFFATTFGQRSSVPITIGFDSSSMQTAHPPKAGTPQSALTINGTAPDDTTTKFKKTIVSDSTTGKVVLSIVGGDPGNPRKYIDGQIYGLTYAHGSEPPPLNPMITSSDLICVLLFDPYTVPDKPSWIRHIYPIMKQYANLYPCMDRIVKLDDYGSCVYRRVALRRAFGTSDDDPHYMPVTRDMSRPKKQTLLKWLDTINDKGEPLYMDITDKGNLVPALQCAVCLEHATIPMYLTALYSIKEGYNQYASDSIRAVALDEMLHLALVCNLMISIGEQPDIGYMGFVPKYPGPLPGGLRRGLIMRLRKCSVEQIKAFMTLEAPGLQAVVESGEVDDDDYIVQSNNYTIGFLYDLVKESLTHLHDTGEIQFPDDEPDGVTNKKYTWQTEDNWPGMGTLGKVKNLADALAAIDLIKEQGEGSTPAMPESGDIDPKTGLPELSHYFRFSEIAKGRRLVNTAQGFEYKGERIILDEEGIYNMRDDPTIHALPEGSQERERSESFSRKYQAMLNGLQKTFSGDPTYLTQAVALMYQITMSAKPLMEMPNVNADGTATADGTTIGISFQMPYEDAEW